MPFFRDYINSLVEAHRAAWDRSYLDYLKAKVEDRPAQQITLLEFPIFTSSRTCMLTDLHLSLRAPWVGGNFMPFWKGETT